MAVFEGYIFELPLQRSTLCSLWEAFIKPTFNWNAAVLISTYSLVRLVLSITLQTFCSKSNTHHCFLEYITDLEIMFSLMSDTQN